MASRSKSIAAALALLAAGLLAAAPARALDGEAHVIDGDTIVIAGEPIRLFGVEAPRDGRGCVLGSQPRDCRLEATFALARMIGGRRVRCGIVGVAEDGQLLGLCRTDGGEDLNRAMVARGWARAHRPHTNAYLPEEDAARTAGLGIWYAPPVPAKVRADAGSS